MRNPDFLFCQVEKHVLRCLKGTANSSISSTKIKIEGLIRRRGSDYARCNNVRRKITGTFFNEDSEQFRALAKKDISNNAHRITSKQTLPLTQFQPSSRNKDDFSQVKTSLT